jgi:superfamily II DNA or RNA helicase
MLPPCERYTLDDLKKWFGEKDLKKAKDYVDLVEDLTSETERMSARVPGTAAQPYEVTIRFTDDPSGHWRMQARCTCPVGSYCKHSAAVLLRALRERDEEASDEQITPGVLSWIQDLRQLVQAVEKTKPKKGPSARSRLFYLLAWNEMARRPGITVLKGSAPASAREWHSIDRALLQPPQFVDDDDLPILRLLWAERNPQLALQPFGIDEHKGSELLSRMLATGRLLIAQPKRQPLSEGTPRTGHVLWQPDVYGRQQPRLVAEPVANLILPIVPPWYVDFAHGQAGPLEVNAPPEVLGKLLTLPPLTPREASLVAETLAELAPGVPVPEENPTANLPVIDTPPHALLTLDTMHADGVRPWRRHAEQFGHVDFDYAVPQFVYGEVSFQDGDHRELVHLASGELVRVKRDAAQEQAWLEQLRETGLERVPAQTVFCFGRRPTRMFSLAAAAEWPRFVAEQLPQLTELGWEFEYSREFRHHRLEVEQWDAQVHERDGGWFDLDMGIVVDGRRLPLAPLLSDLFKRDPRWLDALALADIADEESIDLITEDELRIRVTAERLKPLARVLIDLFDNYRDGPLRLSRLDAPRLAALQDRTRWQFHGSDSVSALAERLSHSRGVQAVDPPPGFALTLRTYQLEGLGWLQYLREHQLSGILADDMGLGKTAQALAHLLLEKQSGRMDRPSLVVLPTSLIFNWKNEVQRFAPQLSLLSLHGAARKPLFEQIPAHDLILTTYPLLWRDGEELSRHDYHLLILDEAQTVKNSNSRSAGVVRRLTARHRLCLTGTPLENHLGELWSQFDFLLPGFLGDSREFTRRWRTPIEKHGDMLRRDLLAGRIRPFILRRRKEEVATELPAKTVILRTVELTGDQRDLYETVRVAMDEKVRGEIASRGFRRSQIIILDALLKLRQVCCDPRLVKATGARKVKGRAKLDLLMDMLPELVDEGRRILVFSQFTSMLDLIEVELNASGFSFLRLSGDTVDRETPVRRFQAGEVPIFLISLKAGGVGLNLTAADTVIHYDPWWNPAVENQATDRAHRLGQDKPVFVYKLIAAGSIEERILALQEKKAELAAGILADDRSAQFKFGEDDLAALFSPLPDLVI